MTLCEKIKTWQETLALVGLGYVGIPIAVEFSKRVNVIGFDINKAKIEAYKSGIDLFYLTYRAEQFGYHRRIIFERQTH